MRGSDALSISACLRRVDGELVMRAYTPTSSDDDMGYFDLVIKARAPAPAQPVLPMLQPHPQQERPPHGLQGCSLLLCQRLC